MRHLEELKEKYKDGWWEGHDGYTGDDMCSDIKYLIWYIEETVEAQRTIIKNQQFKVEWYERLIGAIANIDGAFITVEGDCKYTDKQALEKIMEWVDPIWTKIAQSQK